MLCSNQSKERSSVMTRTIVFGLILMASAYAGFAGTLEFHGINNAVHVLTHFPGPASE